MSELAVLLEWAIVVLEEVFAHLGLVLLLQAEELTVVAVHRGVILLLSQLSHDLAWRVVEVFLWLSVFA